MANAGWLGRGAKCAVAGIVIAASIGAQPGLVLAQQPPKAGAPAAKAAPPAKGAPAAQGQAEGQQSAWVKLCESAELQRRDKDGKEVKETKNICLTHHERLDGNSGMVLVSAAIRDVEGMDKPHLMVMVPLGMAIPPGLRAVVYPKDIWEKAQKNEKFDEKVLKPIDLKYSLCHPAGCTAEVEATKELVDSMKTGGGLMVLAINAAAQQIAFPVPLDGFANANAGPPVDNAVYAQARGQLMQQIRARQAELFKQYQEQQQAQQQKQGGGAAAGAPAQQPPAKK